MSANQSQLLLGGMVLCPPGPGVRRCSSGGLPEGVGSLSVVLVLSRGMVIRCLLSGSSHPAFRAPFAAPCPQTNTISVTRTAGVKSPTSQTSESSRTPGRTAIVAPRATSRFSPGPTPLKPLVLPRHPRVPGAHRYFAEASPQPRSGDVQPLAACEGRPRRGCDPGGRCRETSGG